MQFNVFGWISVSTFAGYWAWAFPSATTVATFLAVVVPAAVGAAIYILKNLAPEYFAFMEKRDAIRRESLSGRMDALLKSLEDSKQRELSVRSVAEENANLARVRAERIEELVRQLANQASQATAQQVESARQTAELIKKTDAQNELLAENSKRIEAANSKLHKMSNVANENEARARLAELDLEETLKMIRDHAGVPEDVRKSILSAVRTAENIDRKVDHVTTAVDKLIHGSPQPFEAA